MKSPFLKKKVEPIPFHPAFRVGELVEAMGQTAFQGKNLSLALTIWLEMLRGKTTIFLGLAGAMVPAGMRRLIAALIERRYIDGLVSTGANFFHDLHETLGYFHWQGSAQADDLVLKEAGLDRIYDVYAAERDFRHGDKYLADFADSLDPEESYSTRRFFQLLGERLVRDGKEEGIISAAFRARVPLYCPAIGDSSIGIALSVRKRPRNFQFDLIQDVWETAEMVACSGSTGVIYLGGGTPKNFIQQTEVTADQMGKKVPGHKYAIQITTDAPHWGGLSGCTFEEAQSWGKVHRQARMVTLYCDTTIALPILVTALAQRHGGKKQRSFVPDLLSIPSR